MGPTYSYPNSQTNRKFVVGEYTYDVTLNHCVMPMGQGISNLTGYGILYRFRSEWKMAHNSEAVMWSSRQISQWSLHRVTPAEQETASTTKFRTCPDAPEIHCKLDQILNLMCTQTNPSLIVTFDTWEWTRDVLFHAKFQLDWYYTVILWYRKPQIWPQIWHFVGHVPTPFDPTSAKFGMRW